jgi:hypothetical protein
LKTEVALSAGYDDIGYEEDGVMHWTSDYAAGIEMGGLNPRSASKHNAPRPYIGPTHQLAESLKVMPKNFEAEFRKGTKF